MTPNINVDETVNDLVRKSCKYSESDSMNNIRDECKMECEEQGEYIIYADNYIERQEGTIDRIYYILVDGEFEERVIQAPNIIYELQETATTFTYPPCDRFCESCSYLE